MILLVALLAFMGCAKSSPPTSTSAAHVAAKEEPAAPQMADEKAVQEMVAGHDPRPVVRINSVVNGVAGGTVAIEASLEAGNNNVAALSTELWYDPAHLGVATDDKGQPACQISETIGQNSQIRKQLFARERRVDADAVLRVALLGPDNANPVPDGKLFTCNFRIPANAAAGSIPLIAQATAASSKAQAVPIRGTQGAVVVN